MNVAKVASEPNPDPLSSSPMRSRIKRRICYPECTQRFWAPYAGRRLSISLFSLTFGLSSRPSEIGLKSYSTILLPQWMRQLADHRRCGELMAHMPGEDMPLMVIVDYSAIDAVLAGLLFLCPWSA